MFFVFIGPDGSGKTTVINHVVDYLRRNQRYEVILFHGRFGIFPELKKLKNLLWKVFKMKFKNEIDFTQPHSGSDVEPHGLTRSIVYLIYYSFEYLIGGIKLQWLVKIKRKIVIFDRYFLDYFFQKRNRNLPHWVLWAIYYFFVPKPSAIIFLERDPCNLYKSKNELSINEILTQQKIIKDEFKRLKNFKTINGNKGIEVTVVNVLNFIEKFLG